MDWIEEVRPCVRASHLSPIDQAYFVYDHLEGEAKVEKRYRRLLTKKIPNTFFFFFFQFCKNCMVVLNLM